jgi:aminoglycoside phosphotransferase
MSFHILAVGRPGMGEESTVERAAARAAEEHAALTLMGIWSPARLIHWARLAGVDPAELIREHAEQSSQWLRGVVAGLPADVSVKFACRRGLAKRHVAAELRSGHYDELVISSSLLGERCRSRLRREHPELRVELVDPVEILLAA